MGVAAAKRWKRLREPLTGRQVLRTRADCGVELWVAPMAGYRKTHAMITTRYGSLDTHLPDGSELPDGIAHFLEHKMFQTDAGDVFDIYAERGASANAFTTFTHTSYLFTSTRGFDENLATLLETMASITTTDEGIEREKGIIGQELAMYDDDPGWRGYFGLLQALYRRHPVRIDIGGTPDTIAPIDAAILQRAHAAYYSPANLLLFVAGEVEPGAVLEEVNRTFGTRRRGRRNRRAAASEPARVADRTRREALAISRPHVWLGFKDTPGRGPRGRIQRRVQGAMLMEILCGDGGLVQAPLYDEGWVDDTFGGSYEAEHDYAFAWMAAEVDAVEPFRRRLRKALGTAAKEGFDAETVERCKRRFLGRHLRVFNTPESCVGWMQSLALEDADPGALVAALKGASVPALRRRLRELVAAPQAWMLLEPRG